jgi:hypothetical protein
MHANGVCLDRYVTNSEMKPAGRDGFAQYRERLATRWFVVPAQMC